MKATLVFVTTNAGKKTCPNISIPIFTRGKEIQKEMSLRKAVSFSIHDNQISSQNIRTKNRVHNLDSALFEIPKNQCDLFI